MIAIRNQIAWEYSRCREGNKKRGLVSQTGSANFASYAVGLAHVCNRKQLVAVGGLAWIGRRGR